MSGKEEERGEWKGKSLNPWNCSMKNKNWKKTHKKLSLIHWNEVVLLHYSNQETKTQKRKVTCQWFLGRYTKNLGFLCKKCVVAATCPATCTLSSSFFQETPRAQMEFLFCLFTSLTREPQGNIQKFLLQYLLTESQFPNNLSIPCHWMENETLKNLTFKKKR